MANIKLEELYGELNTLWGNFQENHEQHSRKGNKAAGRRARSAIGDVKKLVTEYRRHSVSTDQ
jgi:hypothetical protein|tara:strand:+ start:571 stop:759 length:189 start_codon:yes stop_codon:yes gene_type:complete